MTELIFVQMSEQGYGISLKNKEINDFLEFAFNIYRL